MVLLVNVFSACSDYGLECGDRLFGVVDVLVLKFKKQKLCTVKYLGFFGLVGFFSFHS